MFLRSKEVLVSLCLVVALDEWSQTSAFHLPGKLTNSADNLLRKSGIGTQCVFQSRRSTSKDLRSAANDSSSDGGIAFSPGEATLRLGLSTGPTVWTEFGRIAQEYNPVNLGQGFPDWLPPKFAVDSLVEAVLDSAQSPHQYTRPAGHPNLVNQLARRYSIHIKRDILPMDEVAVTVGASQALYLSLQTLIKPGDEVILFEPFFDLYVNQVKLAGGTPVYVPLRFEEYGETDGIVSGGEWKLDRVELMKIVSPRTKAIILNSPHNPTGKIFTRNEMEVIAESLDLAGPDCVVLSDEVYKYIVHSPPKEENLGDSPLCAGHTHFASLPGMWDRTITISSAGKTFSATGWQVGW
jgi:kynurenine--oxoglutarate transaminase/cysteine-S-conjugate beta-lyase/glutamine--phenylpyruvate transaminase